MQQRRSSTAGGTEPYRAAVGALRGFQGIATLTAMRILAELHDIRRFQPTHVYLAQSGTTPISIPKIIGPRSSSNTTTMGTSKMFKRTPALAICGSVMRPLP